MVKHDILVNMIMKFLNYVIDILTKLRERLRSDKGVTYPHRPITQKEWLEGYHKWKEKGLINTNDTVNTGNTNTNTRRIRK